MGAATPKSHVGWGLVLYARARRRYMAVRDPVCHRMVEEEKAAATYQYKDKTFYFCAAICRDQFVQNPEKLLDAQPVPEHLEEVSPESKGKGEEKKSYAHRSPYPRNELCQLCEEDRNRPRSVRGD